MDTIAAIGATVTLGSAIGLALMMREAPAVRRHGDGRAARMAFGLGLLALLGAALL